MNCIEISRGGTRTVHLRAISKREGPGFICCSRMHKIMLSHWSEITWNVKNWPNVEKKLVQMRHNVQTDNCWNTIITDWEVKKYKLQLHVFSTSNLLHILLAAQPQAHQTMSSTVLCFSLFLFPCINAKYAVVLQQLNLNHYWISQASSSTSGLGVWTSLAA